MIVKPMEKFIWKAPIMGGNQRTVFHLRIVRLSRDEIKRYIDTYGVNPSHLVSFRDCDGHRTYIGWIQEEGEDFVTFKTINGQIHRFERMFKKDYRRQA